MTKADDQLKSREAWLTFDLPVHFDERGVIDTSMAELNQLISKQASLFSLQPSTAFINTIHAIQSARLVFSLPKLRVAVQIPVRKQLDLFQSKAPRSRRNLDLFGFDEDAEIQAASDACVAGVESIEKEIAMMSDGVIQAAPDESQVRLSQLSNHPNSALRAFVVGGGKMDVDIDGHSISIEAPGVRSQTLDPNFVVLRLRLLPHSKGSGATAKILEIVEGSRTHLDVGKVIRVGFLERKPAVRALLLIAMEFDLTVCAQVRFAVSVERRSLLAAEVIEVKNATEILEAFQQNLQAG